MARKIMKTMCYFIVFVLLLQSSAFALVIQVVTSTDQGYQTRSIDLEIFKSEESSLIGVDPNFKKDGSTKFSGISIRQFFAHLKIKTSKGITIVARDQYIGYLTSQDIEKDIALLAWAMNDKPILDLKGGPLKIVYPDQAGMHGACYIWYADTIFVGDFPKRFIELVVDGNSEQIYLEKLLPQAQILDHKSFSIPAGCKNGLEMKDVGKGIKVVSLQKILTSKTQGVVNKVTLVPFAGSAMTLDKHLLECPISIALSCGVVPIHPSLGGPFSVLFPIEKCPEHSNFLPESGALFFLKEIIVE